MHSSDAAESIVRMSLNGLEVAAKISGSGAKNVVALIYTILKDKKMSKGKTNLANMLKTGKELKIFTVNKKDLKKFADEAKRYGILFSALVDKKSKGNDGVVDIMVKAEDAARINRIVTRYHLGSIDETTIRTEIAKDSKEVPSKGIEVLSVEDKLIDEILSKPVQKEENEVSNPDVAKMEKSPPSEPSLENRNNLEGTKSKDKEVAKPSVREDLKNIKAEQKKEMDLGKSNLDKKQDVPSKNNEHIQPKNKKKKVKDRA